MAKFLIMLEFESEVSHPRKWNISEILDIQEGESAVMLEYWEIN